jgi:hypothetical protein
MEFSLIGSPAFPVGELFFRCFHRQRFVSSSIQSIAVRRALRFEREPRFVRAYWPFRREASLGAAEAHTPS